MQYQDIYLACNCEFSKNAFKNWKEIYQSVNSNYLWWREDGKFFSLPVHIFLIFSNEDALIFTYI